jgi:two-component system NtrC family response regulator
MTTHAPSSQTVLLVDDDDSLRRVLEHHLTKAGYTVITARDGVEGLDKFMAHSVGVTITDVLMEGMDGTQLLRRIRAMNEEAVVIVITAHGTIEAAVEAMKLGALDYITKPFNREELLLTVERGFRYGELLTENRSLRRLVTERFEIPNMVGTSPAMRRVYATVEKVARTDATVLISGESGTGKEIVAKAVHQNSRRKSGPFIVVNCGAIPEGLLESEMFGHRKGAFTGAVGDTRGLLEAADGGTVFLDEVGEMPLALQVKFLRALQENEVTRVGETQPRKINVRFIAATNRSLLKMIEDGTFREDLFFRLNVVPLNLPPLRDRREDIPLLADFFLRDCAVKYDLPDLRMDRKVHQRLMAHPWPGNVRELKNVIERMVVLADAPTITVADLPDTITATAKAIGNVLFQLPETGIDLEEVERDLILAALEKNNWNQTHAARYLNLTRSALIYRMQKFRIDPGRTEEGEIRTPS